METIVYENLRQICVFLGDDELEELFLVEDLKEKVKKLFTDNEFWKERVLLKSGIENDVEERRWARVYYGLQNRKFGNNVEVGDIDTVSFCVDCNLVKDYEIDRSFNLLLTKDKHPEVASVLFVAYLDIVNNESQYITSLLQIIIRHNARNILKALLELESFCKIATDLTVISEFVNLDKDIARDILDNPNVSQDVYEKILWKAVTRGYVSNTDNILRCGKAKNVEDKEPFLTAAGDSKLIRDIINRYL